MPWFFLITGALTILAAALDWDWFMNHRKAQRFVSLFGRTGARIFYLALGAAVLVGGSLLLAQSAD